MADEVLNRDENAAFITGGVGDTNEEIIRLRLIESIKGIKIACYVYDTGTTSWVAMQQPVLEVSNLDLTVTMGDVEKLLAKQYYLRMKPYTHASERIKYVCKNTDIDASETDTDWFCWKYSDADIPEIEGPRQGAVNTEGAVDALSWAT